VTGLLDKAVKLAIFYEESRMNEALKRAEVLVEALPYIQRFYGKPVVIHGGGEAISSWKYLPTEVLEPRSLDKESYPGGCILPEICYNERVG